MRRYILFSVLIGVAALGCGSTETPMNPENHPPSIFGLRDTVATVGDSLVLRFVVEDPEGSSTSTGLSIILTRSELAEGYWPRAGLFVDDNIFWYTPRQSDGEERSFQITASDASGLKSVKEFNVRVISSDTVRCSWN